MKENFNNNISDPKNTDKTKTFCLKTYLSKLKEFNGIEILECLNSRTINSVYKISYKKKMQ